MVRNVYYWKSDAFAEVDFIISYKNKVIPIEVKSGINPYSKSLKVYIEKYQPSLSVRASLQNVAFRDKLMNIALFTIFNFISFIEKAENNGKNYFEDV